MTLGRGVFAIGLALFLGAMIASLYPSNRNYETGLAAANSGDYVGAHEIWRQLAQRGGTRSQYRLGLLYEQGLGTESNHLVAAHWYKQAAAQGHAGAIFRLGMLSFQGRGMPHDDAQAVDYFLKAAKQGHPEAQFRMGFMYQTGRGVPLDLNKARYWYGRANANGFEWAINSGSV